MDMTTQDYLDEMGITSLDEPYRIELEPDKVAELAGILNLIDGSGVEQEGWRGEGMASLSDFLDKHGDLVDSSCLIELPDGRKVVGRGVIVNVIYCDALVLDADGNVVGDTSWDSEGWA